jgi:hypothetical protein|tara:strand:- start:759 stop:1313 length:555 start_codon:yes stop_codon:yes gene_type:complete
MGRSRRVQQGCLYHIGGKSKFDAFTLGPDPEFTFVLFRCVSLAAVIILRAINRRASVQIASAMFKEPVAGKPEYVCLSNSLVKEYGLDKAQKYKEVNLLLDLGFLEEHERKSWNSSRVVRIHPDVTKYKNILKNPQQQKAIKQKVITLRKRTRPIYAKEDGNRVRKSFDRGTGKWKTDRIYYER